MKIKTLLYHFILFIWVGCCLSCAQQPGVTNKREFRPKNPPSVKIKEEFDRSNKKAKRGTRMLRDKDGKSLEKALNKHRHKKLKRDKKYLKRKKKKLKKKK